MNVVSAAGRSVKCQKRDSSSLKNYPGRGLGLQAGLPGSKVIGACSRLPLLETPGLVAFSAAWDDGLVTNLDHVVANNRCYKKATERLKRLS